MNENTPPPAPRGSKTHELKCWPEPFAEIMAGRKRYEIRRNDRDFRAGDFLHLLEWNPTTQKYTGSAITVYVPHLTPLPAFGATDDVVVMSIVPEETCLFTSILTGEEAIAEVVVGYPLDTQDEAEEAISPESPVRLWRLSIHGYLGPSASVALPRKAP